MLEQLDVLVGEKLQVATAVARGPPHPSRANSRPVFSSSSSVLCDFQQRVNILVALQVMTYKAVSREFKLPANTAKQCVPLLLPPIRTPNCLLRVHPATSASRAREATLPLPLPPPPPPSPSPPPSSCAGSCSSMQKRGAARCPPSIASPAGPRATAARRSCSSCPQSTSHSAEGSSSPSAASTSTACSPGSQRSRQRSSRPTRLPARTRWRRCCRGEGAPRRTAGSQTTASRASRLPE